MQEASSSTTLVAQESRWRRWVLGPWHLWALLGLTLAGAGLRFWNLEHPPIWYDEAATYGRVCGTWDELWTRLKTDGFMPGHYVAYWWLGKQVFLDPFWMRFIPALAGTLTIPATYFLARQLCSRRVALTAALLACTSAYYLAFSRDAKMYMHTWFAVTMAVGCLLWWLRTTRWWAWIPAWLGWLLFSSLAVWLNANALIVVALMPLFVLLRLRCPWWRMVLTILLFTGGMTLVGAGPWWYYSEVSSWAKRTGITAGLVSEDDQYRSDPDWRKFSGLTWIPMFHAGRDGFEVARHTASSFALGWEWPQDRERQEKGADGQYIIPRWTLELYEWSLLGLGAALGLALLPWPARWRGLSERDPPVERWWLVALILGIWTALPIYGYYCRSFKDFQSPATWLPYAWGRWGWWTVGVLSVLGVAALVLWLSRRESWRERWRNLALLLIVGGVLWGLCWLIYAGVSQWYAQAQTQPNFKWDSVWWPRYLGVILPGVWVGVAALLWRLPTWPVRTLVVGALVAVNLGTFVARMQLTSDPPWDVMAADVWAARERSGPVYVTAFEVQRDRLQPWPLSATVLTQTPLRYYYAVAGRLTPTVAQFRNLRPRFSGQDSSIGSVAATLRRRPAVHTLVIWERYPATEQPAWYDLAKYQEALGPSWVLQSERSQRVRQHISRISREWNWQQREWVRRLEFVRVEAPTTRPATRPAPAHAP